MTAKLKFALVISIVLLGIGGLFFFLAKTPARELGWIRHDVGKEVFGSTKNLETFLSADSIVACRLRGNAENSNHLSGYDFGSEIQVSIDDMDRLKALFKGESSYKWNDYRYCAPNYGVLITARENSGKSVSIALCFECRMIGVFEDDQLVGSKDFDFIRNRLTAIIKNVFPDDKEIQALP